MAAKIVTQPVQAVFQLSDALSVDSCFPSITLGRLCAVPVPALSQTYKGRFYSALWALRWAAIPAQRDSDERILWSPGRLVSCHVLDEDMTVCSCSV